MKVQHWFKLSLFLVLALFYLPAFRVLAGAFGNHNAWHNLVAFVQSGTFRQTLGFSMTEALLSAGCSLILALPGAYFFGRYRFPGKNSLRSLFVLPFMLPGILVVLGMVVCYGQNGTINHWLKFLFPGSGWQFTGLYGFSGIVLANVFYNLTFCLRVLGESWERLDPRIEEASRVLGTGPAATWFRLTLPLLMPNLIYLFLMVFIFSFLSFTIVLVLGGYLYKTFEVLIYIEYNGRFRFDQAVAIAWVQALILAGVLYIQSIWGRRSDSRSRLKTELPPLDLRHHPCRAIIWTVYLLGLGAFFLIPLGSIFVRSFHELGLPEAPLTFANYRLLFENGFEFAVGASFGEVLANSLGLALVVAVLTVGCGYFFARCQRSRSWGSVDFWLQMPLAISFLTFTTGLAALAGDYLPPEALIIWAQVFLTFPLIYSMLRNACRELDPALTEAAALLGATPLGRLLTVELPLLKKPLVTAFAYAMALSLGDLAAVLSLGNGEVVTLSVAIYRLIGHYRFAQANALGAIFIVLAFGLFLVMEGYGSLRIAWLKGEGYDG